MSFYIWRKTFIKVDELSRNIQSKVRIIAIFGYIIRYKKKENVV